MPAEAAPVEVPAAASKFAVEVLRQTPFGHARRRSPFEFGLQSRPLKSVAEVVTVKEVLTDPCHVRSR